MITRAVTAYTSVGDSALVRPLFLSRVQAGRPSPAGDEVEEQLDLNRHIFRNPEAMMMLSMRGDGFGDDGVFDGDLLIADSSVEPAAGRLVVVQVGQEQLIKKVVERGGALYLVDGRGPSEMIELEGAAGAKVLAVVTFAIHTIPD